MSLEMRKRLAANITALRKTAQLTQAALAEELIVGRSTYAQFEQGDRLPDLDTLYALSQFYHVRVDTLVCCDLHTVLTEHFVNHRRGEDESRLLFLYTALSDVSKGRLLERAEVLAQLDKDNREHHLDMM